MSSTASGALPKRGKSLTPGWFWALLGSAPLDEGESAELYGTRFIVRNGVLRHTELASETQAQTSAVFAYKWAKRETFDSEKSVARMQEWLVSRYGSPRAWRWLDEYADEPVLLDAGCGAGLSALALLPPVLHRVRYVGADISTAVDVARVRFAESGVSGAFIQCDLNRLPLPPGSVDVIFSEGVLHHTDSPTTAFKTLARLLKPGGRFLFYVYGKKGPIREFSDDYIRAKLQALSNQEAWDALLPLSQLGRALGELNIEVDVPEDIALLGIPAGRIDIQRLFYWHVCKAYYRPEMTLDEMNHVNFDWYAPANAHRQTPEEVRAWCAETGLVVERESVEEAGITIIARKSAAAE